MCVDFCERNGNYGPYSLYDPCCGAAGLLTQIALLNTGRIAQMAGSDIDSIALETARSNFALLNVDGANERLRKIEEDLRLFGKESHRHALESARRILQQVARDRKNGFLPTFLFERDATSTVPKNIANAGNPHIVIADIPYGNKSVWVFSSTKGEQPITLLLESLLSLPGSPIVAIAAGKGERLEHPSYQRLKRFSAGKRQIVIVTRNDRGVEEMSGGSTSGRRYLR